MANVLIMKATYYELIRDPQYFPQFMNLGGPQIRAVAHNPIKTSQTIETYFHFLWGSFYVPEILFN